MSFARFSSDDWKSDVYVYESDSGFEIHVATNRITSHVPPLLSMDDPKWFDAYQEQMQAVGNAAHEPINGPFDGEHFSHVSAQGAIDTLKEIIEAGYHVPDWVIPELEEEVA